MLVMGSHANIGKPFFNQLITRKSFAKLHMGEFFIHENSVKFMCNFNPWGYFPHPRPERYPRIPNDISTMDDYKRWIDGYDCGVKHVDDHIACESA